MSPILISSRWKYYVSYYLIHLIDCQKYQYIAYMGSSQLVRHQKRHFSDQFKSYSKFFLPTQHYLVDISPHLSDKTLYFQIHLVWCMEEKLKQHYSLSKNQPFLFLRKKCLTKHHIVHSSTFFYMRQDQIFVQK